MNIVFRKPDVSDLDALFIQKNDPDVKKMLGGISHGYSRRDLEDWLEAHRKRTDEVLWSIIAADEGRCLGHVGLYKIDPIVRSAEFGIMIGDKDYWGKGIGKTATHHAITYAFKMLNLNRVSLTVLESNERAKKLYGGLGFVHEGTARQAQFREGNYVDLMSMGILRSEYLGQEVS